MTDFIILLIIWCAFGFSAPLVVFWVIHKILDYKWRDVATRGEPRVWCKVCQCYHNMAREILLYPTPNAHELTWDDPDHPPR